MTLQWLARFVVPVLVAVDGIVAAYDSATGNPRWSGAGVAGGENYSSPHLMVLDGVEQALLMSATGTTSVEPANGRVLWEHVWSGVPIVQPAQTEDGDVLVTTAGGSGALGLPIGSRQGTGRMEPRRAMDVKCVEAVL